VKQGGKCLVIIDDAHFLYGPNGHASAARLIHLIDGWTDGQMKDSKGFWGIAMTPLQKYDDLIQNNPSRRRRFERYDMTVLSGGRLRAVVDEILDEWEERLGIAIPEDVRDRVVEIMAHPANDMANPYASLNLLDRIQASLPPMEKTMTRNDLHYTFARLHRLNLAEVAQWTLYSHVQESILAELAERFPFLSEKGPNLIPYLSLQILNAWKQGDQSLAILPPDPDGQDSDGRRRVIPETFIEKTLQYLYEKVDANPLQVHSAQGIIADMRNGDRGDRQHRLAGVKKLPAAPSVSERRPAANA
jgi:hypothetical protein